MAIPLAAGLVVSSPAHADTYTGSGFFISETGYFVTNHHVIEASDDVRVRTVDGKVYRATVVKSDAHADLAILKVAGSSFRPLAITHSEGIRRGETVYALGFPQVQIQGLEPKLTEGSISSLSGMADDPKTFQISNPIQPGSSGGPLVTEAGAVVGVVAATLDAGYMQRKFGKTPQNVNYAIKSSLLLEVLKGQNIPLKTKVTHVPGKRTDMIAQVERSLGLVIASSKAPTLRSAEQAQLPPRSGIVGSGQYPDRAITLLVPFAAGGPTDTFARWVAIELASVLRVPVVVQNVLGEGGVVGTKQALQAPADGYTLLFQSSSLIATSLGSGTRDDWLWRDLVPIGKVLEVPLVIVANTASSYDGVESMRSLAQGRGGVSIAHAPAGTIGHSCALAFNSRVLGGSAQLTAYRGSGPALTSVLNTPNSAICDIVTLLYPHIKSGQVKAIAIASGQRLGNLYEVPTLLELGDEAVASNWNGIFAPKGTPDSVVGLLSQALQIALGQRELREALANLLAVPASIGEANPEYLTALVHKDHARFRSLLK